MYLWLIPFVWIVSGVAMYFVARTLGRHWSIWAIPCAILLVGLGIGMRSSIEPSNLIGALFAFYVCLPSAIAAGVGGWFGLPGRR